MKSNAPGQLLGYACQFPRALCHLLKSSAGDIVCVEVLGDVATVGSDGAVIAEEDKSSTTRNPLSDRSKDLWKTLSNWIEAINDGELFIDKTKFILYCNHGVEGIVTGFSSVQSESDASAALDAVKSALQDIKQDSEIWKYYNYVMNQNVDLFKKLIIRFELQIGDDAGYKEICTELRRKIVPENQIEFLMKVLSGWLQKKIIEKIEARERAVVSWEEFNKEFLVLFERVRRLELIDFTFKERPKKDQLQQEIKIRPRYLRQLEAIDTSVDDILESVSDFLRAKVNRDKWIENQLIDEDIASEFESNLERFWKNKNKMIAITQKDLSDQEKGQLLLAQCKASMETIRNVSPPPVTIAGTYHALADKPVLGWHPNWERLFPVSEDES